VLAIEMERVIESCLELGRRNSVVLGGAKDEDRLGLGVRVLVTREPDLTKVTEK